jgi:hypothetical protein
MSTKNKTTELLKELAQMENNFSDRLERRQLKSELRGRLDVLKEEEEFIKNFQTNCLCERCGRLDSLHRKRLASIQEEIKLIEDAIC